jgi:hypothetical protein
MLPLDRILCEISPGKIGWETLNMDRVFDEGNSVREVIHVNPKYRLNAYELKFVSKDTDLLQFQYVCLTLPIKLMLHECLYYIENIEILIGGQPFVILDPFSYLASLLMGSSAINNEFYVEETSSGFRHYLPIPSPTMDPYIFMMCLYYYVCELKIKLRDDRYLFDLFQVKDTSFVLPNKEIYDFSYIPSEIIPIISDYHSWFRMIHLEEMQPEITNIQLEKVQISNPEIVRRIRESNSFYSNVIQYWNQLIMKAYSRTIRINFKSPESITTSFVIFIHSSKEYFNPYEFREDPIKRIKLIYDDPLTEKTYNPFKLRTEEVFLKTNKRTKEFPIGMYLIPFTSKLGEPKSIEIEFIKSCLSYYVSLVSGYQNYCRYVDNMAGLAICHHFRKFTCN